MMGIEAMWRRDFADGEVGNVEKSRLSEKNEIESVERSV